MYKIALTRPVSDWGMKYLSAKAELMVINAREPESILSRCDGMDALISRGIDGMDERFFKSLSEKGVKVVAAHGTGLDGYDLAMATKYGIPVVYAPGANSRSVAEYTVAAMIAMIKEINLCTEHAHDGDYSYRWGYRTRQFEGMRVYVIGFGNIGRKVASMCQGLGMTVAVYDRYLSREAIEAADVVYCKDIYDGLADADIVTIHVPLTEETRGIANAGMFDKMKPGAYFVNTARSDLMDEDEVVRRVNDGRFGGAVLDATAFDHGRPNPNTEACRKIIYSCHIAAMTKESLDAMAKDCADGIFAILNHERWEKTANKEVYDKLNW